MESSVPKSSQARQPDGSAGEDPILTRALELPGTIRAMARADVEAHSLATGVDRQMESYQRMETHGMTLDPIADFDVA